jgi:hypothetical protein
MSQMVTVALNGAVQAGPANASTTSPSLLDTLSIATLRTYGYKSANSTTINNPSAGTPFVIPLAAITKVRFCLIRVTGASVQVLVTSAAGTDQTFKVSDELVWSSPNEGDQLTAIKLVGVADIEYLIAGD